MNKFGYCPIVSESQCTGCSACMNVCPQKAISIAENSIGHIFPNIDKEKCIECGLCRKVCPSTNLPMKQNPLFTFAAWAINEDEHSTSTSGGISSVISSFILKNNGVVYGCIGDSGGKIYHKRISNVSDISLLKGSKYVQSEINYVLREIEADLKTNLDVLFIGTPCQVAGARSFLKKEYTNFYAIDLICHGVPPQKLLFEYLELHNVKRDNIDKISFREGEKYCLSVYSHGIELIKRYGLNDDYLAAFNDCLFHRESCIKCMYSTKERCGDITLGDFRRLGVNVPFNEKTNGNVSVVLVNTNRGKMLIDECSNFMHLVPRELDEAVEGNPQLRHPSIRKGNYKKFKKIYQKEGLQKALNRTMLKRHVKNLILKYYLRFCK